MATLDEQRNCGTHRDGALFDQGNDTQCSTYLLPCVVTPKAPPIKTQGIKTKVVPLIARSISWSGDGRWIEPFLGSGVVALNIMPPRAILADTNEHVINVYRGISQGTT